MFYLLGSLLFAVAMMAAFAVMISNFSHYRRAMMIALRSLDMRGFATTPRAPRQPADPFRLPAAGQLRQAGA